MSERFDLEKRAREWFIGGTYDAHTARAAAVGLCRELAEAIAAECEEEARKRSGNEHVKPWAAHQAEGFGYAAEIARSYARPPETNEERYRKALELIQRKAPQVAIQDVCRRALEVPHER